MLGAYAATMIRIYNSPAFVPRADDSEPLVDSRTAQRQNDSAAEEHRVVVSAEIASRIESAEEISFYMSEQVEQKHHAERKINLGPPGAYTAESIRRVPAAQKRAARFDPKTGAGGKANARPGPWTPAKVQKSRR